MNYSPPPFSQSEEKVTGRLLLADNEAPRVRIECQEIDGGHRFSVTSAVQLGRTSIAHIMAQPLDEVPDWKSVEKGLRGAVYPSRTVKNLDRSAEGTHRLRRLRAASDELAEILRGTVAMSPNEDPQQVLRRELSSGKISQREFYDRYLEYLKSQRSAEPFSVYDELQVKAPVFDEGSAITYAEQMLFRLNPQYVLGSLAKYSDPQTIKRLEQLTQSQFSQLSGLSKADQAAIEIGLMRYLDGKSYIDVVHDLMDSLLVGYRNEATYDELGVSGGGRDPEYYVRRTDVPGHLKATHDVRLLIERELREHDPETGLPAHQLKFVVRKNALVAHPRVVWTNRGGVRAFELPTSRPEPTIGRAITRKPSSLLGMAIVANQVGMEELDIDYKKELARIITDRSRYNAPLARAGMLGLVLHAGTDRVLQYPYFASIERDALK